MQGKNYLKVTGILMIIGGGLTCLVDLFAVICVAACSAAAMSTGTSEGVATGIVAIIFTIIGCADGVLELITGIVGVKNCDKPEKANLCMILGIVVAIISIISLIGTITGGGTWYSIVITIIFTLAIPVLYIIGAVLNKKAA